MLEIKNILEGSRLDKFLMNYFPSASLSEIYRWIRTGRIKINRKKKKGDYRLQKKDKLRIFLNDEEIKAYKKKGVAHKKSFTVLYEDEHLLVINKPPFLASQGGIGVKENNLINQVRFYLNHTQKKIALANRLDLGTSGIVILGKNPEINSKLYEITKDKEIEKKYYALVIGRVKEKKKILKNYIKKTIKRFKHVVVICKKDEMGAKYSETEYEVKAYYTNYTLLELKLKTGRMHQIRVQMAQIGHPVLGDSIYGDKEENKKWSKYLKRQFLHASMIKFKNPMTKKSLTLEAPLSKDLKKVLGKID
tara:strand:- start:247 stop:1164 length:918 start_codon:yes stop_codon:yes gene_type:complete